MHFQQLRFVRKLNLGVTVNGDTVTIPNSYINGWYLSSYENKVKSIISKMCNGEEITTLTQSEVDTDLTKLTQGFKENFGPASDSLASQYITAYEQEQAATTPAPGTTTTTPVPTSHHLIQQHLHLPTHHHLIQQQQCHHLVQQQQCHHLVQQQQCHHLVQQQQCHHLVQQRLRLSLPHHHLIQQQQCHHLVQQQQCHHQVHQRLRRPYLTII